MSFTKLREIRDRFEQQWINGGFIFGYENEINENHNNDYPLLVVLPPTSELPATEGDVQEEYTFECLVVKPYYQNQAGSLDVVFSLLEQEGLTWLQRVLDSYTTKQVILSPDSISVEREKELYNDKLIQVRLTFTLNAFSHSLTSIGDDRIAELSPKVWLRADMGVKTEFFGGNEVVNKWLDQSGNGNHFEQTASLNKPTYKYENTYNSYPYIDFDGTSDYMSCVNNSIVSGGLNREHTVVFVGISDLVQGGTILSKDVNIADTYRFALASSATGSLYAISSNVFDDDNDRIQALTGNNTSTTITGYYLNNKTVHIFQDGVHIENSTNSSFDHDDWKFGTSQPLALGSDTHNAVRSPFKGQIQELMIFNNKVSDEEMIAIHQYLKHKYKI